MKFNKPIAFLLALLILLPTAPALAADSKYSTGIEAECLIPEVTIQVVVPTESEVYVNPQSLPVKVEGKIQESQIVSQPVYIENQTEVPLTVSATVIGTLKEGSGMILGTSSTTGVALTSKKAFIYFEMKAVDSKDAAVTWDEAYNADNHIPVRTVARNKKKFLTLGAAGKAGSYGAFHLAGDCVANPKTPWTEKDGVDVSVSFTFTPVPNE